MSSPSIQKVVILGGGPDGLLAGLSLKTRHPQLDVEVIRGPEASLPAIDESTDAFVPEYLHDFLQIPLQEIHRLARPIWKIGTKMLWGPREFFFRDYEAQFTRIPKGTVKTTGYHATGNCDDLSRPSALMAREKAFGAGPLNRPSLRGPFGYHIRRDALLTLLHDVALSRGVVVTDDQVEAVHPDGPRIGSLQLRNSGPREADLYIDASGDTAAWISGVLGEPFLSYDSTLPIDSWVAGYRPGTDRVVLPYTTIETRDHGWSWQFEHEDGVQLGYAYSSRAANASQIQSQLGLDEVQSGSLRSGRVERAWVENVIAIGSAGGGVEPLASTSLSQLSHECRWVTELLDASGYCPGETERRFFNRMTSSTRDETRDFLAVSYRFNNRLDSDFWIHCRENTDLAGASDLVAAYRELGPSLLLSPYLPARPSVFGMEGFISLLVGMQVPHDNIHLPHPQETEILNADRKRYKQAALSGLGIRETLAAIRNPNWQWQ